MKENKNLRFGIIGTGRIAERHAKHINRVGQLCGCYDLLTDKALTFSKKFGGDAYQSLDQFLLSSNFDVVSVCSPNGLHAEHTINALKSGYHVLCEKPMAINVHDCGEMIKTAERMNKRLFIVKQNRFNPPVVAVKELIENNKLGKIYSIQLNCFWNRNPDYYQNSWKGSKKLDGGTLFTQFSHFVDLIYYLIGDVKEVNAVIGNYDHKGIIEFEDSGVVNFQFYNGTIGTLNYSVNAYKKNMEGSLTIFAEKGTVKIGGQYLNELEYQEIDGQNITNLPEGNKANNYGTYVGSMSNHDKVYDNLVDVLESGGEISTNGFEGLKTVEIIDKIYSSAKWVTQGN